MIRTNVENQIINNYKNRYPDIYSKALQDKVMNVARGGLGENDGFWGSFADIKASDLIKAGLNYSSNKNAAKQAEAEAEAIVQTAILKAQQEKEAARSQAEFEQRMIEQERLMELKSEMDNEKLMVVAKVGALIAAIGGGLWWLTTH